MRELYTLSLLFLIAEILAEKVLQDENTKSCTKMCFSESRPSLHLQCTRMERKH